MPRLPKLFGRKQAAEAPEPLTGGQPPADLAAADAAPLGSPDAPPGEPAPDLAPSQEGPAETSIPDAPSSSPVESAGEEDMSPSASVADRVGTPPEAIPADAPSQAMPTGEPESAPALDSDRRPAESKTLIGGKEADLVPVIPDTEVEVPDDADLDEASVAAATVEALQGACRVMVDRVNALRRMQDGTQIVAGLIALVGELDVRYANDWGIVRRNGLEEVLIEVRESVVEGDRFILESLENGRGGLTADVFLRDLRTIAQADRPRMVAAYAMFLVFVLKCVLRQYLRPLEHDQALVRDVGRRLEYLIDGIRDSLLARINGIPRLG